MLVLGLAINSKVGFKIYESLGEENAVLAEGVFFQKPDEWALHKHSGKLGGYELTTRLPRTIDRVGLYSVKLSDLNRYFSNGEQDSKLIGAALVKQISDIAVLDFVDGYQQVSYDKISYRMKDWSEYKLQRKNSLWVFYYTIHHEDVVVINFTFNSKKKADLNIHAIFELLDFQDV
jgi:hypothetical protein